VRGSTGRKSPPVPATDGSPNHKFAYGRDYVGSPKYQEDLANANQMDELYAHDALHRLTSFKRGDLNEGKTAITTDPPVREQSWTLQHVGNWDAVVSKTNGSDDSPYDARTHDKDNEIETIDPQGAVGSFTVVHDAAGNLKELPDRTIPTTKCERYSYDYRNRLIKIEHSDDYDEETPTWSTVVQYEYDGLNRRVKKDLASGTDVVYLWDEWQMIEEQELDESAWEARRQYVYGGLYVDEPVVFDKDTNSDGDCTEGNGGSTRYLYAQQANFNVVALTDGSGTLVERVKYDPYGEATVAVEEGQSASGNPYLFTGRHWDPESHLYYFRNRFYSPRLGRFTARDRVGYVDGANLYCYVRCSPLSRTDPTGEYGWYEHFKDSLYAARDAGFCPQAAFSIAQENQGWDEGGKDALTQGVLSALGVGLPFGTGEGYQVHFPGAGAPTLLGQKPVVVGSAGNSYVRQLIEKAKESCSVEDIGKALHALQDSYAHEGQPDVGGHPKGRKVIDPVTGKERESRGASDVALDYPSSDPAQYAACKADVASVLKDLFDACGCVLCPSK